MVTAAIAAFAAVLALAVVAILLRGRRARSEQRFEAVLGQIDRHMSTISQSLQRVVERSADARAKGVDDLELTVDFDELLRRIATEAASRTEAEAAAVHIQGPGGLPAQATFGAWDKARPLEAPLSHTSGPFRAVTINWTYRPGGEHEVDPFASALVVPIVEGGVETGTLAAYSPEPGVFAAEQVRALEALAEEAGPALTSARRFADAQRAMTDVLTGLRNSKGYEVELERAVARAHESGRPLSLLILNRDAAEAAAERPHVPRTDLALQELASLLVRLTRTTDVVCLRGDGQFGIVLHDTAGDPARRFYGRLLEAASRTSFPVTQPMTFAAGLVEWRPSETSEALDARALAAVGHNRIAALELAAAHARTDQGTVPGFRESFQERLGQEIARARNLNQPLALLIMDIAGLRLAGEQVGRRAVDAALSEIESRVGGSLEDGDVGFQVGEGEFALILTGSTTTKAESVFAALQASLEAQPPTELEWLDVAGGITECVSGDDVASLFGRAQHALWRAKRAGPGTVVVALAADDSRN